MPRLFSLHLLLWMAIAYHVGIVMAVASRTDQTVGPGERFDDVQESSTGPRMA